LRLLFACLGWLGKVPHWTTGRLWLLRLGHARLIEPLQRARDWVWLIDHSVQIGQDKCLVILGIRLVDLPPQGQALRPKDMKLIALEPMRDCAREDVRVELQKAVPRTGVPRVIIDDHEVGRTGGVNYFQADHPGTVEVYDTKHKGACLLKALLEKDERWAAFNLRVGQTRSAIQQTELAFLVPPGPRPKARFMNLRPLLGWGQKVSAVVAAPRAEVLAWASRERLQEKLGWLQEYQEALAEWGDWQRLIDTTVVWVGEHGLYQRVVTDLELLLPRPQRYLSSERLADELFGFLAKQAKPVRAQQRVPASTEVLESCFGKFKVLERGHSKGGFTGLVLGFGALLAAPTLPQMRQAMQTSPTKDVRQWCHDHLGTTLRAKRQRAFQQATPNPSPLGGEGGKRRTLSCYVSRASATFPNQRARSGRG
jgi:hypothetical protein